MSIFQVFLFLATHAQSVHNKTQNLCLGIILFSQKKKESEPRGDKKKERSRHHFRVLGFWGFRTYCFSQNSKKIAFHTLGSLPVPSWKLPVLWCFWNSWNQWLVLCFWFLFVFLRIRTNGSLILKIWKNPQPLIILKFK